MVLHRWVALGAGCHDPGTDGANPSLAALGRRDQRGAAPTQGTARADPRQHAGLRALRLGIAGHPGSGARSNQRRLHDRASRSLPDILRIAKELKIGVPHRRLESDLTRTVLQARWPHCHT